MVETIAKVFPYKGKEINKFTKYDQYHVITLKSTRTRSSQEIIYCTFMQDHSLVYKYQYGFRTRHATTDAVTEFCQ